MERDDSYYDIYYYTGDGIDQSKEDELRLRDQADANFENPRTPRASGSLEEVVRKRTPTWISRVLRTHIRDDVSLEDIFANCWLLYVEFSLSLSVSVVTCMLWIHTHGRCLHSWSCSDWMYM